jgi:hypothetical protein
LKKTPWSLQDSSDNAASRYGMVSPYAGTGCNPRHFRATGPPNDYWVPQGFGEEDEPTGLAEKAKGVVAGFALLGVFKAMEKNAESEDEPGIEQRDPVVLALAQQARQLAHSQPDDDECVHALRKAAGSKTRNLSKAAASVRFAGQARESRIADRANRHLMAAYRDEPVRQLREEEANWFDRIDEVMAVRVEDAFPHLVEMQPKLRELEGKFAPRSVDPGDKDALWHELIAELAPVVGPEAVIKNPSCGQTRSGTSLVCTLQYGWVSLKRSIAASAPYAGSVGQFATWGHWMRL